MEKQQTIKEPISMAGRGLFLGQPVNLTFRPAPPNHGITFVRTDLDGLVVPAHINYITKQDRRTVLAKDAATIATTEHCLSALAGLKIDNIIIEIDAEELPSGDTSAKSFLEVLTQAGIEKSDTPRKKLVVKTPVSVSDGQSVLSIVPCNNKNMQVTYELDYGNNSPIGHQLRHFDFSNGDYAHQIAPARTFLLEQEARIQRSAGIGKHLTADDILVFSPQGPLGNNQLRFSDEAVRHKIVDLIGDLYLLGMPLQGRIIAHKSGHALNHQLCRKLLEQIGENSQTVKKNKPLYDIRKLSHILPHRYPMLLVDRVLEIQGQERAVGIKNVTFNEPFFQGHYPGIPIMPGVLIVEAMAQLAGVLVGQKLEHTGKLAVLLSLDRVKLRKPVTPGDQLVLEARTIRLRRQLAHMQCFARVDGEVAAEAEIKFMLVDDEG